MKPNTHPVPVPSMGDEVSGSWPRSRRYAVGDVVEVILTGRGFRGARYEATVIACLPGSDRYKVLYSELLDRRGVRQLREVVAASDVRPRPPPPPPGRELEVFDLVEAYHNDGWWPGVVFDIQPKRRWNQRTQFVVSFPLFRQVVKLSASFVRPRLEFVYGSWIDAQEVLRGIPQYAEGSHVEVMCDKEGRVWRPAIIKKMVGSTNYVVSYGKGETSIEILHTRFIRPEPIYDKMKLEPSAEVEVYHDGIWSLGVIADVGSCEPRRYRVKVKEHSNTYGNDYMIVSSASLRPRAEWGSPEWRIRSTKKYARKRNYPDSDSDYSSDSGYSLEFSTPGGNSDQDSSIPNKRVRKENAEMEEVQLRPSFNLEDRAVEKLICTPCDGNLHLENVLMKIDDSAAECENHEMCQKITEVNSWVAGTSIEGAANQKTVNQSYGGAFPTGKLEPSSSRLQDFESRLLCIEAPNDNKVEIKNERMGMSLVAPEGFSTTSLLLMPNSKMEVFEKLPQIPHFREAWNCPPELREGRAIGLMVSFANIAESIKNMQIQDEPRLYEEKMNILIDMEEENGFEAGPLKVRLHNLLCTRNCQINLKGRKVRLEKDILEIEAINCGLEQQLKVLDMCIMGMEEKKYQEMKASLDRQNAENCSSISKLQFDLCQVEESLKYAEANFCSIATAPWQLDVAPLLQ